MKKITMLEYGSIMFFLCRGMYRAMSLTTIINNSKQDSWLSIIIAMIIGLIPILIILYLMNKFPNSNIFEINNSFGIVGKILNLVLIINTLFIATIIFWNLNEFISSQFLFDTPKLAIGICFLIPIIYTLQQSLETLSHSSLVLCFIGVTLFILIAIGLSYQINYDNIKPTLIYGIKPVLTSSFYFITYNILPLICLLSIPKNKINNFDSKKIILFYFICELSLFIIMFLVITIFGIELSTLYQFPDFLLLKRTELFGFIDRTDSILAIEWLLDLYMIIVILLFFVKTYLKTKKIKYPSFIMSIIAIICCITSCYIFANRIEATQIFNSTLPVIEGSLILIVLIIMSIFSIKKKSK